MPVERAIHVVTYARFRNQEEPDVLDQKVLKTPANPAAQVEGDASKALVSKTENHQCNGDASAGGCKECHAYAEERVVSRLVDPETVAVTWRKYHPLAARGRATPGKPFEAEHDGVQIRVEAREVVDGDAALSTPKSISWLALRGLEAELKAKQGLAKVRSGARETVDAFERGPLQGALDKLEALKQRLADLPTLRGQPPRAELFRAADEGVRALASQVGDLEAKVLNAADPAPLVPGLAAKIAEVTPRLEGPLAPLAALEKEHAAWLTMQGELRQQIDVVDDALARRRDQAKVLPTLDAALAKLGTDAALAKLREGLTTMLEASREDDWPWSVDEWRASVREAEGDVARLVGQLDGAIAAERAQKVAFDARLQRLRGLSAPGGDEEQRLVAHVEAGGMLAGFATRHFVEALQEALAEVRPRLAEARDLALSYHAPRDAQRLEALEGALAPVNAVLERATRDMARRAAGAFPRVAVGPVEVTPPSVWATVTRTHAAGKVDLTVSVRANGPEPMLVALKGPDGKELAQVGLRERGHRVTLRLEGVAPQLAPVVIAASAAGAPLAEGEARALQRIELPAAPIGLAPVVGNARHVLPSTYTASPAQPRGAADVRFELPAGATAALDAIPGEAKR
jgi:hypothetical protein